MNRKRDTYDRIAVGERIRRKRILIGLSQDEFAERIDRATKYCSDIERGICGMSVETMLSIAGHLDMSLDYLMFGEMSPSDIAREEQTEQAISHLLSKCSDRERDYAIRLLKLYISSMNPGYEEI